MVDLPDLSALPAPEVIEELSYEAFVSQLYADIKARFALEGVDWDVDASEADSAVITGQAQAYRELIVRTRVNYVAQQGFLYFAEGSNLDQLVAWLGITRLAGESDDRLRARYRLATYGRSAGGPLERYEAVVMGASVDVRAVAIWREGRDPTLNVAVLAHSGGGEPTPTLLGIVEAALLQDHVRVVSDRFNVFSAIQTSVDVEIAVRLEETAADSVADTVAARVQSDWLQEDLLGLDLTEAFLISSASAVSGVTDVEVKSPEGGTVAGKNEVVGINSVAVTISGRGR